MPETTDYMVLGFAVTVLILAALVGYLWLKARNLRKELATLEMLAQQDSEERVKEKHKPLPQSAPTTEQPVHR